MWIEKKAYKPMLIYLQEYSYTLSHCISYYYHVQE